MASFDPTITKRVRRRRLKDRVVEQTRWFCNFSDPRTGQRKLPSFETRREAEAYRDQLLREVHSGSYVDRSQAPTVAQATEHYLRDRATDIKASTLYGYRVVAKAITGPLLSGTALERSVYAQTGALPRKNAPLLKMLGDVKTSELTTADIRAWHKAVLDEVGRYTANRALSMLKSILALCEEDFGVRAPSMPTNTVKRRSRPMKEILAASDVAKLLDAAQRDPDRGIYYAFPFLSGTRISEQLALLWDEVDFDAGVIRIRRIQERDGSLSETTKTDAGRRDIPMTPTLKAMLLAWRERCPLHDGKLHRVFPGPGRLQQWPLPRKGGGGPLLYPNFRKRIWRPIFEELGLPYVTPHAARHAFISILQAQGVEVGLVAKLAGHADPAVTLGHYTQAVRGGADAILGLDRAYQPKKENEDA